MLFNVKCAENFTLRTLFLYENVVANTFVKWTVFGSFLRLWFLQIENFDPKNSFQKGLRDMFMAEDKRKHESVCDAQLFKRNVIRIHSYSSCGQAIKPQNT